MPLSKAKSRDSGLAFVKLSGRHTVSYRKNTNYSLLIRPAYSIWFQYRGVFFNMTRSACPTGKFSVR
jgi:hypothetical protein